MYPKVSLDTTHAGRVGACTLVCQCMLTVHSSSQPPADSGSPSVLSEISEVLWEHSAEGSLACPCASHSSELCSFFTQVVGVLKALLESGMFSEIGGSLLEYLHSVLLRQGEVLA